MNTSYGIGDVFAHAVEGGATLADAVKQEVAMIQSVYETPVAAQEKLMDSVGQSSFDCRKYMKDYRTKMSSAVRAALDEGVHYGKIAPSGLPRRRYRRPHLPVHLQHVQGRCDHGDIEAVTEVMDTALSTCRCPEMKSEYDVLSVATGARCAIAAEYILELDGVNAIMVVDLPTKR